MITFKRKGGITAKEMADAMGATLNGEENAVALGVAIDSREEMTGGMFVAIVGERTDGHQYIADAIQCGAKVILAQRDRLMVEQRRAAEAAKAAVLTVEDTVAALGLLAKWYLSLYCPKVVAITGSVGKTTTKEYIYAVMSRGYRTHKTDGNYNSVIGLPLTVLNMEEDTALLVLEMGMSGRGEIRAMTGIAHPDIAAVTNIGTSHIGLLGSREAIRDAKMEIAEGSGDKGTLILNGDEPLLLGYDGIFVAMDNRDADVLVEQIRQDPDRQRTLYDLRIKEGKKLPAGVLRDLAIPAIGRHVVFDAAVACVAGLLCGLDEEEIRQGLLDVHRNPMRQHITKKRLSDGEVTVIEDCYNASPESMTTALQVLKTLPAEGRRIAVLGDMRELGDYSAALHRSLGEKVAGCADLLFTYGEDAALIGEGAKEQGMKEADIESFSRTEPDSAGCLARAVAKRMQAGDVVLFKASRSVEMEKVAEILFS